MRAILLKNIVNDGKASDILIEDGHIVRIALSGESFDIPSGTEVVDCSGKALMPGLVNMHTHAGMSLMRGVGEDIPFHEWLDRIWALEEGLDE